MGCRPPQKGLYRGARHGDFSTPCAGELLENRAIGEDGGRFLSLDPRSLLGSGSRRVRLRRQRHSRGRRAVRCHGGARARRSPGVVRRSRIGGLRRFGCGVDDRGRSVRGRLVLRLRQRAVPCRLLLRRERAGRPRLQLAPGLRAQIELRLHRSGVVRLQLQREQRRAARHLQLKPDTLAPWCIGPWVAVWSLVSR